MFQYIALSWDVTIDPHCAAARGLSNALDVREGWQVAARHQGLRVYTSGARQGANGSYPLTPHHGVVIGRLFRRSEFAVDAMDVDLAADEVDRIVRTTGGALVDDFWGRYVAFLPAHSGGGYVLRDPSGALPCYRLRHEGVWITFSWLEGMLDALPSVPPPPVSWDGIAAHLLVRRLGGSGTALEGVFHVPAGELVSTDAEGRASRSLWSAVDIASRPPEISPDAAVERLRPAVRLCVRSWAGCYEDILLRLSGGLDSAILLSCLDVHATAARVTCLNYHSPGSDSDERPYARSVADHMGMPLIERACDASYPLENVLDVALTPAPESYVGRMSMAVIDAETAAAFGARAMFTGGGGDQLFFEHRCTHPAADYLCTRGLDGGLAKAVQDAARLGHVSVWTTAYRMLVQAWRRRGVGERGGSRSALICGELRLAHPPDCYVHPSLALAGDLPIGKLEQVEQLVSPFGYYDPYVREAAPELVNPLLSQPLIELCLALPTYLLTHGGRGRALARRAFCAELPREITTRRSKGGMEEHLAIVLQRNLTFARELLLDGQLVARRLLDRARVEAALSGRPSTFETHVGEIHGYIALEAWLSRCASLQQARAA